MKRPDSLREFLEYYPEEVLLAWLKAGRKASERKKKALKTNFGKKEAQEQLRKVSAEELEQLINDYRKENK